MSESFLMLDYLRSVKYALVLILDYLSRKNVTYRRHRNRTLEPSLECEEEVEEEAHPGSDKGKGSMGDEDDAKINNLFNILNDLAKG